MATISVRDLDEDVAARLKVRAARHGRSMEAEVRTILTDTLTAGEDDRPNLAQAIRERFAEIGGVELEVRPRQDNAGVVRRVQAKVQGQAYRDTILSELREDRGE